MSARDAWFQKWIDSAKKGRAVPSTETNKPTKKKRRTAWERNEARQVAKSRRGEASTQSSTGGETPSRGSTTGGATQDMSLKRRPGESRKEFERRINKQSRLTIAQLERQRDKRSVKTKDYRERRKAKRELERQRKAAKNYDSEEDEWGVHGDVVGFGERVERPPELSNLPNAKRVQRKKVVTLVDRAAKDEMAALRERVVAAYRKAKGTELMHSK